MFTYAHICVVSMVLSLRWHAADDPYPTLRIENQGKVLIIIIY